MKKHMKIFCFMKFRIKRKTSRIRFDRIEYFIRLYDGTRYLKLFAQINMKLFRKEFLLSQKSG